MRKAAFCTNQPGQIERVYSQGRRERLAGLVDLHPTVVTHENFAAQAPALAGVEAIFSTWGLWSFSDAELAALPQLRAVFYGAGSVQHFARPLLARGVTVVNASYAIGTAVAEFTAAQTVLANKGYFRNLRYAKLPPPQRAGLDRGVGPGNFEETVALLGAGAVGRQVIARLQAYRLKLIVFDPFLSDEAARALGVEQVSLADAFRRGSVISNHLASLPATKGMLKAEHFRLMRDDATFINTGRGATVVEADLIAELERRPTLVALLDVTDPEPPAADSPLYRLPNVYLTSHIAGSVNRELAHLADTMIAEYERWAAGQAVRHAVTLKMLETMA